MNNNRASRRAIGYVQEDAACQYLEEQGYTILERNYYIQDAEVDIIAMDGDCLCFVEVRSRENSRLGHPLETVNLAKQRNIIKAANHFIMCHNPDCPMRFDVVGIVMNPYEITLVKDAFQLN